MNRIHLLFAAVYASASLAQAAPRSDTIDFPKNMEFSAQVTLLNKDGSKPAHGPLKEGQQVELHFDVVAKSTPKTVPCTLNIPKKIGQIAAGEAAVIGIKCSEPIDLPRDALGFKVFEGGHEIGSGAFRP